MMSLSSTIEVVSSSVSLAIIFSMEGDLTSSCHTAKLTTSLLSVTLLSLPSSPPLLGSFLCFGASSTETSRECRSRVE
jgi:hypothetical protein